jgi:small-conductance mechanosensitive channel
MNCQSFCQLNIWAALVAAFVRLILGSFWYSPFLFGTKWMIEARFTEKSLEKGYPLLITAFISFVFSFLGALALEIFITTGSTALSGAGIGALVALFWISTAKANTGLFEHQSLNYFLIHAGYDLAGYAAMGAILGAWIS